MEERVDEPCMYLAHTSLVPCMKTRLTQQSVLKVHLATSGHCVLFFWSYCVCKPFPCLEQGSLIQNEKKNFDFFLEVNVFLVELLYRQQFYQKGASFKIFTLFYFKS